MHLKELKEKVIDKVMPKEYLDENTKYFINPTGRFEVGGPTGDSGLTGRKIIVDTYGGYSRHGGGAFSGKDPTKVDRSAAYAARYVAKNIVAAGLAKKCEVQIAYAIGVAEPVSVLVDTFGTNTVAEEKISETFSRGYVKSRASVAGLHETYMTCSALAFKTVFIRASSQPLRGGSKIMTEGEPYFSRTTGVIAPASPW